MALINPPRMPGVYGYPHPFDARPRLAVRLPRVPTPSVPAVNPYLRSRVVAPQNQGLPTGQYGYTPFSRAGQPTPSPYAQQPASQYLTDDQIQAQAAARAKAIYDPLIQQIVDSINRRGQQGAADLAALTGEYAQAAQGYANAIPGIYGPAKQETLAAVTSLADRLKGEGSSSGQALNANLAQAGVQGPSDINLAQQGAGAGNAAYGTGIAELDRLIANQAAAQTFAAGEPSRAFAGGQQQLGGYERYLANLLATQQGQLTAQIPGTAESIAQGIYARQGQQQQMDESKREFNVTQTTNAAATAENQRRYNATTAENQRRYNAAQARTKLADRQTMLGNFEARTGYQGVLTSTGVTYKRGPDGQKVPTQATRTDAYNKRQRALGIVGPNAPTVQGRKVYWDTIAENRTRDTGIVHVGTPTGIKPLIDPATGQPQKTIGGKASDVLKPQKVDLSLSRATGQWVDSSGAPVQNPPAKPPPPFVNPKTKTPIKVDVTLSRASGHWVDAAGNPVRSPGLTSPPPPLRAPTGAKGPVKVDVSLSRLSGRWVDASGNPVHAPGLPPKPPAPTKQQTGTEPIRVGPGKWRTRGGVTLSPAGSKYWEKRFQDGFTDGKGHRQPGKRDSSGGTPGLIKKKKAGGP